MNWQCAFTRELMVIENEARHFSFMLLVQENPANNPRFYLVDRLTESRCSNFTFSLQYRRYSYSKIPQMWLTLTDDCDNEKCPIAFRHYISDFGGHDVISGCRMSIVVAMA